MFIKLLTYFSINDTPHLHNVIYMSIIFNLTVMTNTQTLIRSVALSTNLVNMIQTELFQYYHHTWYIYFLWQEDVTYWFSRSGVKGQGHTLHIVVKPCKHDTDWTVSARTVKLGTYFLWQKGQQLLIFKVRGQRSRSHTKRCC